MWGLFWDLISSNWDWLAVIILVVAVGLIVGWRAAIPVLLAAVSLTSYRRGRRDERVVDEATREEQRDAYDRIDAEHRTGSDAAERLREGRF